MKFSGIAPLGLLAIACNAAAQVAAASATVASTATTSATSTAGNFFQVLLGLIVVLTLMAAAAWSLKKFGVAKLAGNATVKIVGGVSVGNRERVVVIEVADQWIVVGVTATQVTALSTMPKQASAAAPETMPAAKNFSAWLKQTIDKRNSNDAQNK